MLSIEAYGDEAPLSIFHLAVFSTLTRIFTTRVCPTCSKAVHRSKLDAHVRRHEVGRRPYMRFDMTTADGTLTTITYRKLSSGGWAIVESPSTLQAFTQHPGLRESAYERLAGLNVLAAVPIFSKRIVAGEVSPVAIAEGASMEESKQHVPPAPNTLL